MLGWRQELHAIPELAFEEHKTSKYVAEKLASFGIKWRRFLDTAIVGILPSTDCAPGDPNIALRAELDALPIKELTGAAYRSTHVGCSHACGHDGHMAVVLGVAEHFARHRDSFKGTLFFVFTPAEEEGGGCERLMGDVAFRRLGIQEVYAFHNWPGLNVGEVGFADGAIMAGDDSFQIQIGGKGGHGAMPESAVNPLRAIGAVVEQLDQVQAEFDQTVLTPTTVYCGKGYNVIQESVLLGGTFRYLSAEDHEGVLARLRGLALDGGGDVTLKTTILPGYPPTINHPRCVEVCKAALPAGLVAKAVAPSMATEDFSYLLQEIPGCYLWLGSNDEGHTESLHNARYDFNDRLLEIGLSVFQAIVEARLPYQG